jgi:23S rRNA (cytidine1920-2'-O)/16S rRNA (cytidine1409-2'-O)-methyltransferase
VENPKPGGLISRVAEVNVAEKEKFVSRGGLKLEAALGQFSINVKSAICADIGASTGGFTDCLLQNGASRVYAVDVGVTQLHEKLRQHPKVIIMDHTNARDLSADKFADPVSIVVMDVSFISSGVILPVLSATFCPGTRLILLIKPQFEAGRVDVSRGKGIIRDPLIHRRVIEDVVLQARQSGWAAKGLINSPIHGGSGNREFLALFERTLDAQASSDKTGMIIDIDAVVAIDGA